MTIVLYAVYCIIMRIELPKHYPAFVVNYKTSHKCTNGSTCGQYLITYIIAVDKADAEEFWNRHYLPTFDGINNKMEGMSIRVAGADERFHLEHAWHFTEKWWQLNP